MLILTALNISGGNGTKPDGTADYEITVRVNEVAIWRGRVAGHRRHTGWAPLLRRIADQYDSELVLFEQNCRKEFAISPPAQKSSLPKTQVVENKRPWLTKKLVSEHQKEKAKRRRKSIKNR